MPKGKVRPPGGQPRGAAEKAPSDGLLGATLPPATKAAPRLLVQIQKQLGVVRYQDCSRPLSSLQSILRGCGRTCWAKRSGG
jgi:hypothetical protein